MTQPAKSKTSSSKAKTSKEPVYTQEEVRRIVEEAMLSVALDASEDTLRRMGPEDGQIIYGIRIIGKDGQDLVRPVEGFHSIPDLLAYGHAPSVPTKVNRIINEMVISPVIGRVVALLQKRNNEMPSLPSTEAGMENAPYDIDVVPPPL